MSPVTSRAVSATAAASLSALAAAPAAASASVPPPVQAEDRAGGDHLTVTVRHAGVGHDGTYELSCHPAAGRHPDVDGACSAVDRNTHWGSEPFARVPAGSVCTMLYGGPATVHVTGTWAGRPVEATYDRNDGCEIARWDRMVPLLPDLHA